MSNDNLPAKAVKKSTSALVELAEDTGILFTPNKAQRAVRARFWTLMSNNMTVNPLQMTNMEIMKTVRDNRVNTWMQIPGFRDWFFNSTEHIERLEYLFDLALTSAEEILLSDDPKTSNAKVQMIRTIAELARKIPSKHTEQFQDEKIGKMSKAELEAFLQEQGVTVRNETVISVRQEDEDDGSK